MNASSTNGFTLFNQNSGSSQNNRIITGTGADLALAADATVLVQYDGTANRWRVVGGSGGGGGTVTTIQNVSASTTLAGWARTAKVTTTTGSVIITLPTAVTFAGQTITVVKSTSDLNSVVINPFAGQTINGGVNVILANPNDSITLQSDGTNVIVISDNRSSIGANKSYAMFNMSASLTGAPIGVNTRIPLNVLTTFSGSDIASTTTGGQFLLKAGRAYRLTGYVKGTANVASSQDFSWYNVTTATNVGNVGTFDNNANNSGLSTVDAIITPNVDTTVELRILNTNATQVNSSGTHAYIEVIDSPQPVTQTVDYINARLTADTSVAVGAAIPFTTQVGNIPNTTGVFTLSAGKTYRLTGAGYNSVVSLAYTYQWRDITNNTLLGNAATLNFNGTATQMDEAVAEAVYTPTTDVTVRLENRSAAARTFNGTNNQAHSWATIVQLGATTQTTSSIFLQGGNALNANAILGTLDSNALTFMASGTEKGRFTAAGAFLIGSSTPLLSNGTAAWLNVVGSSTFPTADLFKVSSATGLVAFEITSAGNMLVGTTTANAFVNVQAVSSSNPIFRFATSTGANVLTLNSDSSMSLGEFATSTAKLTVSNSTTTLLSLAGATLHVAGDTVNGSGILLDAFNRNSPNFIGRSTGGTSQTRTQTQVNDALVTLGGIGYGQTGYGSSPKGSFGVFASNIWTDISQGTYLGFSTTPTGSVTPTEKMRLSGTGQLSVGTTTSIGSFNFQGIASTSNIFSIASSTGANVLTVAANGNLTVAGSGTTCIIGAGTGATNCTSDERLKNNLGTLDGKSALENILNLNTVNFSWKDINKVGTHTGLLAQNVQALFPDSVTIIGATTYANADGSTTTVKDTLGVDYASLVVPAIRALQELNSRIFSSATVTAVTIEDLTASSTISVDAKLKALGTNAKQVNDFLAELSSSTSATSSTVVTPATYNASGTLLTATTSTTTSTFLGLVIERIITEVKYLLANVGVEKVKTKQLCLTGTDGVEKCYTKEDLDKIISSGSNNSGGGNANTSAPANPSSGTSTDPTSTPSPAPTPDPTPVPATP